MRPAPWRRDSSPFVSGRTLDAMPAAIIDLHPARSESSASLALNAPTTIPLNPARSESTASLGLFTRVARVLQALRATPTEKTAAHLHPHDWHLPESMLDAPLLVGVALAATAWRFCRWFRSHLSAPSA
jgi:hypothetical protein